jgi:general secretion pathway protein B
MSYVLDALRKAEAERERGAIPNIHAQSFPLAPDDDGPNLWARPLVWITLGLLLALLGVMAWRWIERSSRSEPVVAQAVPEAMPAAPPALPAAPALPMAPAPDAPSPAAAPAQQVPALVTTAPMAVPPVAPPPAQAPVAVQAPAVAQPAARVAARPQPAPKPAAEPPPARPAMPPAAAKAEAPVAAKTGKPVATASLPEVRIPLQNELPEDIRRSVPTLVIGGSMYSENAANRMLIVGGQLFHEGDKLAPDLVLEQIRLKEAVLQYKGQRYRITY